jgi:hypothetical protein
MRRLEILIKNLHRHLFRQLILSLVEKTEIGFHGCCPQKWSFPAGVVCNEIGLLNLLQRQFPE